jgi:hypothetical protein
MTTTTLLAVLAFGTMGAACIFAYLNVQRVEERRRSDAPPSTLAADGPDTRRKADRVTED